METTTLLKSVIAAEKQYSSQKIERNLVYLQRQIDVLISKTSRGCSLKFLNPCEVLVADCLTCLVSLISDPATKPALLLKCILLFNNLVSDNYIRECLHEKFQITPALADVVVSHGSTSSDTITAEAMGLLQKVSYGHRISFEEPYMEKLVKFLLKNIVSPATGLTQPAMGILVNLTRDNFSVQSYIKNHENTKEFTRTLVKLLGDQPQIVMLFSLTLLFSICAHEKMPSKFYDNTNVPKTFQMIFNMLIDGQSSDIRKYAVDLFKDMLKTERLQKCLSSYEYIGSCVEQTLTLLSTSSHESVVKIFELLQTLCQVKGVKRVVCKAMFATFHIQDPSQFMALPQTPLSRIPDPLLATVHWAGQSTDTHGQAPLAAYDLLIEIYEELIFCHDKINYEKHCALILPTALHTLETPLEGDNPTIAKRCSATLRCVKLLLAFCSDDTMLTKISKELDSSLLIKLLHFQFDHNTVAIQSAVTPPTDDWSLIGVDLVFNLLLLVSKIKTVVMENFFFTIMQESVVVPFLACGLGSAERQSVQNALDLVELCSKLEGFPIVTLGEVLARQNAAKNKAIEASSQTLYTPYPNKRILLEDKENIPVTAPYSKDSVMLIDSGNRLDSEKSTESIHSLVEAMNKNLGLKEAGKESEIIGVYERAVQALQSKERDLQDLLEAKTLALTQADRMLSQYKARKGQDEAEFNKLRSLIIQLEKKCKGLDSEGVDMRNKLEKNSKEIEDLHTENQKLRQVAQMHQQLTVAHTELTERYEILCKSHQTTKQEHQTLTEMHDMLQKHNTNLKQQYDTAMEQLNTLQDERRKITTQLKTTETKLEDTKKASLRWEYDYKKSEEEREVMESSIDKLRGQMAKAEAKKKQLQDQVSQLEFACSQNEQKIASMEAENGELKAEIAKHRQIAALINSLSSGQPADTSSFHSNVSKDG